MIEKLLKTCTLISLKCSRTFTGYMCFNDTITKDKVVYFVVYYFIEKNRVVFDRTLPVSLEI